MLSFISIAVNLALYSSKRLGFKVNIAAANEEKKPLRDCIAFREITVFPVH